LTLSLMMKNRFYNSKYYFVIDFAFIVLLKERLKSYFSGLFL